MQARDPSRAGQEASSVVAKTTHSIQTNQVEGVHPFMVAMMKAPMSEKKTPPVFEKYDESTNPDEQLQSFANTMAFLWKPLSVRNK